MESRTALRGKIKSASKDIDSSFDNQAPSKKGNIDRQLEVGDCVRIIKLDKEATVLERPQGGKVILQAGIMKVTVSIDELEFIQGSKKSRNIPEKLHQAEILYIKNREVKTEIDIRGYNAEEAVLTLINLLIRQYC
jgi:dsDNA-specific endonuclease/ATPase MutS2